MKHLLNTLFVTSEDIYLSLDGENVVVNREKQVAARYPLHTLRSIVSFGMGNDRQVTCICDPEKHVFHKGKFFVKREFAKNVTGVSQSGDKSCFEKRSVFRHAQNFRAGYERNGDFFVVYHTFEKLKALGDKFGLTAAPGFGKALKMRSCADRFNTRGGGKSRHSDRGFGGIGAVVDSGQNMAVYVSHGISFPPQTG